MGTLYLGAVRWFDETLMALRATRKNENAI